MRYAGDRAILTIAAVILLLAVLFVVVSLSPLPRSVGDIWPNAVFLLS